jgi:predicted 2-oxoglutarate/Fe(II)-dependent dioxygenase YbiX
LGGAFEGGELLFGGSGEDESAEAHVRESRTPVTHREGVGILHRGAHCHEATPVASGKRVNLIAWCRSAAARKRRCAMCFRARINT